MGLPTGMSSAELSGATTTDDESVTSGQVIFPVLLLSKSYNVSIILVTFPTFLLSKSYNLSITSAHPCSGDKQPAKGLVCQSSEAQPGTQAPDEKGEEDTAEVGSQGIYFIVVTK